MGDLFRQEYVAKAIAVLAHRGQLDKGGQPYIGHPERVAKSFKGQDGCLPKIIVGWLHDVLEDSDFTRDDLHDAGIDWNLVVEVERLTHRKGESNREYYERVAESSTARAVKLADIADNTDPERLAKLDAETISRLVKKYAMGKAILLGHASPNTRQEPTDG